MVHVQGHNQGVVQEHVQGLILLLAVAAVTAVGVVAVGAAAVGAAVVHILKPVGGRSRTLIMIIVAMYLTVTMFGIIHMAVGKKLLTEIKKER